MTWEKASRLLEATENGIPTTIVKRIATDLSEFDAPLFLKILSLDYESNNIGLSRAKKWLANIFDVFEDEIEGQYIAHMNDLGDAIYYLDYSAESEGRYTLNSIVKLLELDASKLNSKEFELIKTSILKMSSLERKWFIRYWLKTPRHGINEGLVKKVIAKNYKKKLAEVKKHLNFNSVENVVRYYEMKEEPPCNLSHGTFVKPMLAKEVPMNKWPENKIVDYKYDGNRYQIHKQGDNVIIFNRKGSIVTPQFQDVVELVREYKVDCIMDGEIYPIKDDGSPAEHKLMGTRVHSKDHAEAREKVKVKWVMFDCLKYDGVTVMDFPYWHRLEFIKRLPDQAHRMETGGDVLAFYNRAINDGFEGIIVKDASMAYEAGKRSIGWAKYKPPRIELDVVITSARYGDGAKANVFASFDIAVSSPKGFVGVGSVGTGFSDADLISLTNTLRRNVETYEGGNYNVSPVVVLEVSADLVSRDAKDNLGLRFPRCKRIRDDKFVADINTLEDVEALE